MPEWKPLEMEAMCKGARMETIGDGGHSFIHFGYLYSAPSRNLLRGALTPATVKEKCLKKLAERRHVVLR